MPHLDRETTGRPPSSTGVIHRRVVWLWKPERGSASTELVLATPLLMLVLLVAVALGRMTSARLRVDDAAHQAARAASLARTAGDAQQRAQATARAALAASGASCARFTVTTDPGAMTPGTVVRVSVACTANLGVSALPAHVTVTRNAISVIDSFRGTKAA